jgi:hypothetical protein
MFSKRLLRNPKQLGMHFVDTNISLNGPRNVTITRIKTFVKHFSIFVRSICKVGIATIIWVLYIQVTGMAVLWGPARRFGKRTPERNRQEKPIYGVSFVITEMLCADAVVNESCSQDDLELNAIKSDMDRLIEEMTIAEIDVEEVGSGDGTVALEFATPEDVHSLFGIAASQSDHCPDLYQRMLDGDIYRKGGGFKLRIHPAEMPSKLEVDGKMAWCRCLKMLCMLWVPYADVSNLAWCVTKYNEECEADAV